MVGDVDVDGDELTITDATDGAHGSVAILVSGNGWRRAVSRRTRTTTGPTRSPTQVGDGNGGTDVGTVTITVSAVNDAPALIVPFEPVVDEDSSENGDPGEHSFGGFLDGDAGPPDEELGTRTWTSSSTTSRRRLCSASSPRSTRTAPCRSRWRQTRTAVATVTAHADRYRRDCGRRRRRQLAGGGSRSRSTPVNDAPVGSR